MRRSYVAIGLALLAAFASSAFAQTTTGEIYGKVTDKSGAVVPGANVTLTSPALLQPQAAITTGTGVYRFPAIPIGTYAVKVEMSGFTTVVREGIVIQMGMNAQINVAMSVSGVQEVVTVTGESPIIDLKDNSRATQFNQDALQNIPSARDPWVILQQAAGVAMDRENIGGNMSGQQSNFVARGAAMSQQKWNLDGVDITDMSATGGSPVYFDFDAFEEMRVTTGGADVTMQTPGVSVNLLTKSGSDKFRGSARYYITDDSLQSQNVTDELRKQGATSGNPVQNIKDFGAEAGGPIIKGKLWIWGSYGKQDIKMGVNNFFLPTADCAPIKAAPLNYPIDQVQACLNTDLTTLNTYNAKVNYQPGRRTQVSLFFNMAAKIRNARDASDLRPIETTYRQKEVTDSSLGSSLWKTGMPKTYKASLRHSFSDHFMLEAQYAHVGNNFVLDFHEDDLKDVQPTFEITTSLWGRSYQATTYVRPTNSFDITGTHTSSGFLGGDHALRFGFRYRQDRATSINHRGGNVEARFRNGVAAEANMYRDSYTDYSLFSDQIYVQDTYTRGRITLSAGLRFDHQWDEANPASVSGHPFFGKATLTGLVFPHLPAIEFPGHDTGGAKFNDLSPRVSLNWDVKRDGRNVVRLNYARYSAQLGTGTLSSTYNPIGASFVRYPWTDLNGDKVVQPNEINISGTPLSYGGNYNPNNPTALTSPGTNDPNIRNQHTDELIVGFDKQFGNSFAIGVAGIYRKYKGFAWSDTTNWTEANYAAVSYTPPASSCPASQGAQCQTITYFQPTSPLPAAYVYTNLPGYSRDYKGVEITARKRMSNKLMANASFTWGDAPEYYPSGSYEDPTNITNRDAGQFAPQSTTSGIENVYVNAKWMARLSVSYSLPWQMNVAGFYNARTGYPWLQAIQTPSRANGAGITSVFLEKQGDNRLPNFQNLDLRLDKAFNISGSAKLVVAMDAFNVFNSNTALARRTVQNASNANNISAILAPRVFRFGARLTW
jgi:hypothetical protein